MPRKGEYKIPTPPIGSVFGRLTVLEEFRNKGSRIRRLRCLCSCGKESTPELKSVVKGTSKSCGCYQAELAGFACRTHGLSDLPEHAVWEGVLARCNNHNSASYHNYGGRGIEVCDRWYSFQSFYEDMGPRPSPQHSIDRINNDGNYEPGNCRWSTWSEQGRNRRSNVNIEFNGVTQTITEWARTLGIDRKTLRRRLKCGWSISDTLTRPSGSRSR